MENRHLVVIDGISQIDQSNQWLPPATSKLVKLKAGEHTVQVVCKSTNKPRLTWKEAGNEINFSFTQCKVTFTVFYRKKADDVIAAYRNLSGNAPMLPLWAYGFWQEFIR